MRTNRWLVVAVVVACTGIARADLIQQFTGFDSIWEVGTSGLRSSYDTDTKNNASVSGAMTANSLPTFGPQRVSYPNGVGEVPSPGGSVGTHFDQGVLGVKTEGGNLVVQLATGLNPLTGYFYNGWNTWYGQGDMFIDVADDAGISHYAVLNNWGRDSHGNPISLNGGHFNAAQAFHVGGSGRANLEGHLVELVTNSDVTITGGTGSYGTSNAPTGLDLRTFADGGTDCGSANLVQASLSDRGQSWYVQTWTINLSSLSTDRTYDIALHASASCGNDQIGGSFNVPEPSSIVLVLSGLVAVLRYRRDN